MTGASRGIGRAIALELGRLGHIVLVNYVRRQDAADEVVAAIHGAGGHAIGVQGDVARSEDRQSLVDRAIEFGGRLDVLVNNAGITSPGRHDLLEATEENWDQVLGTNLKGPFFLAQLAARRMIELMASHVTPGGKIINISSISAYAISTDRADYCIAKAGMAAMTWLLADRLAAEHIQVFEICPGLIATDMTAPVREKYDKQLTAGLVPQRRWGQPEDVARAVGAIASDALPTAPASGSTSTAGFTSGGCDRCWRQVSAAFVKYAGNIVCRASSMTVTKSSRRKASIAPSGRSSPRGVASGVPKKVVFGAVILAVMVFAAYAPALRAGFIFDDDQNLVANPTVRSLDGLRRMWLSPQANEQYYPLTYSTFWIEYHLWGLAPAGLSPRQYRIAHGQCPVAVALACSA